MRPAPRHRPSRPVVRRARRARRTGTWSQANEDYANTLDATDSLISSQNVNQLCLAWTFPIAGVSVYGALATSPIVVNGIVYLQDLQSNVYAIDLQSGARKWEHLYKVKTVGPNGVAVDQGKVFVASSLQTIAALDAATGTPLWSRQIPRPDIQGIDQQLTAITAGPLALSSALNLTAGMPMVVNRLGAVAAMVSLALAGVVYAVDGVALKQAADAWVQAPAAEQTARFASAEALRWLQWGTSSYDSLTFGLALVLFAIAIVGTARIPQPIGVVLGVQGIAYLVVGWDVGAEGLALSGPVVVYDLSSALLLVWMVWLLIVAWRMRRSVPAASG